MKNFLKIFFLDLTFFVIAIILILLGRLRLEFMWTSLNSFAPQLSQIDPNSNVLGAQSLLSQVNSATNSIYLFLFIVLPLIFYILYILTQGITFSFLKKEKKYFLKFIIINFILTIFLTVSIYFFNYILLGIAFILSYFIFFLYFKDYKEVFSSLKKFHIYFSLYLVYVVLFLLILSAFFMGNLAYGVSDLFYLYSIFGILFTALFSYYKIYLVKKLS